MSLLKSLFTFVFMALSVSIACADSGQEWAYKRMQEILRTPLTLEGALATSWYVIPERDLREHNVDLDWYAVEIKPKLTDYAIDAENSIKAQLQRKFDDLSFDALKKQREARIDINYCSWLLSGSADGIYVSSYDLAATLHTACLGMAKAAITRMLNQHIDEQSTAITDLSHLDLEFPEWLLADLKGSAGMPDHIDPLTAQADYLKKLSTKIDLATPQLSTALSELFAHKTWHDDVIISSSSMCNNILANLVPKQAGRNSRDQLYAHCISEANNWLSKTQPLVISALPEKMKTLSVDTYIPSEPYLCNWTMNRWFGQNPQGLDSFIQPILTACIAKAKPIVTFYIERRAKQLSDPIIAQPATLQGLMANHWFAMTNNDLDRSLMRDDANKQSVADRLFANYQNNIWSHLDKAQLDADTQIAQLIQAAAGSFAKQKNLAALCGNDFSGKKFNPIAGIGGADLQKLKQKCNDANKSYAQQRIEIARQRSNIDDFANSIFIARDNQTSQTWPAPAFVGMAALNGFQVKIEKNWLWFAPTMTITPMGENQPMINVKLTKQGNNFNITQADPLIGFSADPLPVVSCLTYTNDQLRNDVMFDVGANMVTAFLFDEVNVNLDKWFNVGACITARNNFLASATQ